MERAVIVTGGTNGIGLACARRFLAAGDKVYYLGRHRKPEVDGELAALGECRFVRCDVAVEKDCRDAVEACVSEHGRVDVLVNVAGIVGERRDFCDIDLDNVRSVVETNLMGTLYMGRFAAPHMRAARPFAPSRRPHAKKPAPLFGGRGLLLGSLWNASAATSSGARSRPR